MMVYINERYNIMIYIFTYMTDLQGSFLNTGHPRAFSFFKHELPRLQGKKLNVELSKGKGGGAEIIVDSHQGAMKSTYCRSM